MFLVALVVVDAHLLLWILTLRHVVLSFLCLSLLHVGFSLLLLHVVVPGLMFLKLVVFVSFDLTNHPCCVCCASIDYDMILVDVLLMHGVGPYQC